MILALSTSSPLASAALFDDRGKLLASESLHAPGASSGACVAAVEKMLADAVATLGDVALFVAEVGPGSFTGVRVAVTMAKSWAFTLGRMTAGVSSFDLIDPNGPAFVPASRGEYFHRLPGKAPLRVKQGDRPAGSGYGPSIANPCYPEARRAQALLSTLQPISPFELLPAYLAEPSISQPREPYRVFPGKAEGA